MVDDRLGNGGLIMRVDVHVVPGNSGGPLIDEEGKVAGVVYAIEIATGYGLVVPISTLRDALTSDEALDGAPDC